MKPIVVHSNSVGKKKGTFQKIIHSVHEHYYIPMDGRRKSTIFSKRIVDGTKESIQLYPDFESSVREDTISVLAIRREQIQTSDRNGLLFVGRASLQSFWVIDVREAHRFITSYCSECEAFGSANCSESMDFFCTEEDRDRYRDSTWLAVQKEIREQRRSKRLQTLPE
ncbi:hypothetical protein P9G84_10320 [Brevibacillus centrosporus]|uniref:hypothetical protein n=1 Tax=Brevibacillus centrosporus TaxID=54910 RepID=UPI001143F2CB|nr:hypothetical protein [Brevibacillus centrosporus]MEC2129363.1 hypothetical protein [Brevibacillus centrosporus]